MIYKESAQQLSKQGFIKKCPIDHKAIKNLIARAYADIKTAKRNLFDDEECLILIPTTLFCIQV